MKTITDKFREWLNRPEQASFAEPACSAARTLANELAKQIEQQDAECEYPHVPTERLVALLENFFKERNLAQPNDPDQRPGESPKTL